MKKLSSSNAADKRFYVGLFLSIAFCAGFFLIGTDSVSAQSLAIAKEKKSIDKTIPKYKEEIIEKCGDFKFEMEVDYDSFTPIPDRVGLVDSQGLLQVRNALRRVCTDSSDTSARSEEAAAAVRSKIKRIVLTNIADPKKKNIELTKDGVLYVRNSYTEPGGITAYVEMATQLLKIL